jgi:hypothetical protein
MKGIPREVAKHKLNIKSRSKPVKQRLRRFNDDKCKSIGKEILKLLNVGFIREVHHPEWLANPVLIKKKNKKWRMCVEYTSLDKACPKDPFPRCVLQVLDAYFRALTNLCFLNAYSRYQQIAMCVADQLLTSFITPFGAYFYQTMPFARAFSGSRVGMLLCFIVSERGIEANLDKILAIMDMGPTKNLKGVPRVTGFLAALSRFVA